MQTEGDTAGQLVEVRIERLAAGGDGVARMPDGRVLFVPSTAPGDQVRARIVASKSRFARGEVEAVLEPGAARCEPLCPAFGRCGGCSWQHIAYGAQLEAKASILNDAMERIGRVDFGPIPHIEPSPQAYHYRSRARVLVQGERVGFRRRHSRELCAVTQCPVLAEPLEKELLDWSCGSSGRLEDWELVLSEDGSVRCSRLGPRGAAGDRRAAAIRLNVAGESLRISPGVFAQANSQLCAALVTSVCRAADFEGRDPAGGVLELFAGAGFFTLPLARRFSRVTAVESSATAVEDLHANLADNELVNVEVIRSRVEDALPKLGPHAPCVVVLDPPRTGLGEEASAALAELGAKRIVYLSCDPATLARDIRVLSAANYRPVSLAGFDLFPQTPHVEALAVLELATSPSL